VLAAAFVIWMIKGGFADDLLHVALIGAIAAHLKEHYKAVRNEYKVLEENISHSVAHLKRNIKGTVDAYDQIKLTEIAEFEQLENECTSDDTLPIDIIHDQVSIVSLQVLRDVMLSRACPARMKPFSSTRIGIVKPKRLMLSAIRRICLLE
jgi:hypothetical protein